MDETVLKIVETYKHLGIVLASDNKWSSHIYAIIQSAAKHVYFLRKLKYRFSNNTMNRVYFTYTRPLLEYASEVWGVCKATELISDLGIIMCGVPGTNGFSVAIVNGERGTLVSDKSDKHVSRSVSDDVEQASVEVDVICSIKKCMYIHALFLLGSEEYYGDELYLFCVHCFFHNSRIL